MMLCHPDDSSPVVRVRRRGPRVSGLLSGGSRPHQPRQKKWRRPKVSPAELEMFLEFNQNNKTAAVETGVPSRKLPWIEGYGSYVRGDISVIHEADLPVHYWFYVFTHSSDIDFVLKPFKEASKEVSMDKRLMCVMKKNSVTITLKEMELHKSLPRRLIVIKAPDWPHLVSTLADLELAFPNMMRYASFPVMMHTDTNRYPCASNEFTHVFTRSGTLLK